MIANQLESILRNDSLQQCSLSTEVKKTIQSPCYYIHDELGSDAVIYESFLPQQKSWIVMVRRAHQERRLGWSVLALSGKGYVTALDDYDKGLDEERVSRWLGGNNAVGWKVQEGLDKRLESLEGMNEINRKGPENSGNNDPKADLELAALNDD